MRLEAIKWAGKTYFEGFLRSNPSLWFAILANWMVLAVVAVFVISEHGSAAEVRELGSAFEILLLGFLAIPLVIHPLATLLSRWYQEGIPE